MQYVESKWMGLLIALQPSQTYSFKPTHSQQKILWGKKKAWVPPVEKFWVRKRMSQEMQVAYTELGVQKILSDL